jgi:hypothetical protein
MSYWRMEPRELVRHEALAKERIRNLKLEMDCALQVLTRIQEMLLNNRITSLGGRMGEGGRPVLLDFYNDGPVEVVVIVARDANEYGLESDIEFRIVGKHGKPNKTVKRLPFSYLKYFKELPKKAEL